MLNDLLGGQIQVALAASMATLPHVKSGRLRALAIGDSKRSAFMPELPTLAEAGVPGYAATLWLGILAPKGTPPGIVTRLYADLGKLLSRDDVKQSFAAIGSEIDVKPGAELGRLMRAERERWGRLIAESGARID